MKPTIDNHTDYTVDTALLERIADEMSDKSVEVILTDDNEIAALNTAYRGKETPTDVLSFPLDAQAPFTPLGSVVISLDTARSKAEELGHTLEEECALLLIHGILHLLGYDHETDNGEMRAEEEALIKRFELPESLIVRTTKEVT